MIRNNTQRNIFFGILMIFNICYLHNVLHDILNGINFKKIVNALRNTCESFKPHTCINVRMSKSCIVVIAVIFKLCENKIPEFHISVAVAAYFTVGLTATVFFAAVIVDFRAGSARAGTVFPEVVGFAETVNMWRVNTYFLCPDVICFVVLFINGNVKLFGINFHYLCAEFPSPRNYLFFKIITEWEITEHFKVSTVSCSFTYIFNVRCSDTFLAGGYSLSRRSDFTREVFFHRCHTGIYQQ